MTTAFPHLFSPLERGRLRLRNRVIQSGHMTLFADDGAVGPRLLRYYAQRARGGVAAIVSEATAVHPSTVKFPSMVEAYDPAGVPWLDALADAVHDHGASMILQFAHGGSRMSAIDSFEPLLAPSAVVSSLYNEVPRAMTVADIAMVRKGYVRSAANVAASRLDGVEVHAAHGYLPGQFMSPLHNLREDAYGGSFDNRLRFLLEVLEGVREMLRDDQVLGVKLNGSDLVEGGYATDDYVRVAQRLATTGAVDYLTISTGTSRTNHHVVPPMPVEEGTNVDAAGRISAAVDLPVFPVGRIYRPEYAEQLLAAGTVDGVALARALIADPDWVRKAATQPERIRPCVAVNQGCFGYLYRSRPITCVVNPRAGRESEPLPGPAATPRRVAVVGGGPAGMEAARTAAERGHEVTLFEADPELGGTLRLASSIPSRSGWKDLLAHLAGELRHTGVEIRLGTPVDAGMVKVAGFDAVILATGATADPLEDSTDGPVRLTVAESLALTSIPAGARVVVVDEVESMEAYVPAEHLAALGAEVLVVTTRLAPGGKLDQASLVKTMERLGRLGVRFETATASGPVPEGVLLREVYRGRERVEPCTHVVFARHRRSRGRELAEALGVGGELDVLEAGDCVAPRSALEAIREGQQAGAKV